MSKLSIITVNFNNATGLRKTIESVINQKYSDYEYIIIDGGSTDASNDIIREYANKIYYWISEPDKGIYSAMNKGIEKSSGDYLQFLNSGDWFVDETILQKLFTVNYTEDILYGNNNNVSEDGVYSLNCVGTEEEITLAYFIKGNISHQATFYRKNLFSKGLYDEKLKIVSDWKFNIERIIFNNCSIRKINLAVINYDLSGISRQIEYLDLHKAEKEMVISQLVPERIARDYKKLILFSDSPLLKHMQYLNGSKRFHVLISKIVGGLIAVLKLLRTTFRV